MAKILCIGSGKLANQLPALMPQHEFIGIRRSKVASPLQLVSLDLLSDQLTIESVLKEVGQVDAIVFTATPDARTPEAYQSTYCEIPKKVLSVIHHLGWSPSWLHVSSTGVFGQDSGEWVHEKTEPAPKSVFAQMLRASELIVAEYGHTQIVRLAGLYGQGQTHLLKALAQGRDIQQQPWSYTNRIHRDDAARVIAFVLAYQLANRSKEVSYWHGADYDPAPLHQIANEMSHSFDLPAPQFLSALAHEDAIGSQNKRVGNRRLVNAGFTFLYPTYRQGFCAP